MAGLANDLLVFELRVGIEGALTFQGSAIGLTSVASVAFAERVATPSADRSIDRTLRLKLLYSYELLTARFTVLVRLARLADRAELVWLG